MATPAYDNYLATEVRTAAPQKLQLLLIEAALRSASHAREYWRQDRDDMAIGALVHAQKVLGQMLAAIDREAGGELAQRVLSLYEFIFRSLVMAGQHHDERSLADAIRILEIERETWRELCEKISADNAPPAPGVSSAPSAPHFPIGAPADMSMEEFASGFSLEA